ncbi:MAG: alpha/beta fold hydrolase [Anaerolineae bacterium]|nr:alpha/beta fold hydrolase [Anaerolineae bacterium]
MDKTIETGLGAIHAHVEGSGPAIILVHGYHPENTWRVWENNLAALAEMGFAVYALDLIGYGQSGGQQLDHTQQAQAILDLMDSEQLDTAILGGVSWGGLVALELALQAPERVSGLILVDSAGAGSIPEEELETIDCPTLVVWGEDDSVIPLANAAWFGAAIPTAQVETIPDVTAQEGVPEWGGHHPMRFKPAEFNQIVRRFLAA